ncbi:MAG: chemotaxis-specific protein-glutamate methyltransferase CheB [Janthinobacterium lividum]
MTYSSTLEIKKIKVVIVDDSAVIRGLILNSLDSHEQIQILGVAVNGQELLNLLATIQQPDVILLDIVMPILDGLETLPLIVENFPNVKIIIVSTQAKFFFNLTLKAMKLGACDYLTKPSCTKGLLNNENFRQELIEKIILHGSSSLFFKKIRSDISIPLKETDVKKTASDLKGIKLRPWPLNPFEIVAIGASTGGPQVLLKIFDNFPLNFQYPILIVQHMPAQFINVFAKYLQKKSGIKVYEAIDGQEILPGCIYLASGNYHMVVETTPKLHIRIVDSPPENFYRPSIDILYKSLAPLKNVLAIILTGMGCDGLKGCAEIVKKGGTVIVQDPQLSVIAEMPESIVAENLCSAIETPQGIRKILQQL